MTHNWSGWAIYEFWKFARLVAEPRIRRTERHVRRNWPRKAKKRALRAIARYRMLPHWARVEEAGE